MLNFRFRIRWKRVYSIRCYEFFRSFRQDFLLFLCLYSKGYCRQCFLYEYLGFCASCDFIRLPKCVSIFFMFENVSYHFWFLNSIVCLRMRLENRFLCNLWTGWSGTVSGTFFYVCFFVWWDLERLGPRGKIDFGIEFCGLHRGRIFIFIGWDCWFRRLILRW